MNPKIKIAVLGKVFEVSSRKIGEVQGFPNDPKDKNPHTKFMISVHRTDLADGVLRAGYVFYGSSQDYWEGKTTLDENDLKYAFMCLFDDALMATQSFSDFCSELGYNEDSRRAYKIYKACGVQLNKSFKLGEMQSEIPDLLNELKEKYNL